MLSGGRTSTLNGKYHKNAQNSLKIISGVLKYSENDHFEVFNIFGLSQEPDFVFDNRCAQPGRSTLRAGQPSW